MSLTLYYHPLSSFCWKTERAALLKLWPIGKFPVLRDDVTDSTIPESSIIIEYLDNRHPGRTRFIPADPRLALRTRLRDRFYDLYVHLPVQKIVGDRLRPQGSRDPQGVEEARARIQSCYGMIDKEVAARTWAMGDAFSIADCAASPALFYANKVAPFGGAHKNLAAYFERLQARPSFARVIGEAEPYFQLFPQET
jgi:glutathione S-transferase